LGGVCAYSNEAKINILGVDGGLIKEKGAVSEQVALAMARGAKKRFGADIGLSSTGVAGPGGGSEEKPVGLVYIGLCGPWGEEVKKLTLSRGYRNDRQNIRNLSCLNAMNLAFRRIAGFQK
jgi:nicotinamide-nucleotide amidase